MALHPLPVQLNEAPTATVGRASVEAVSYRTEGLLHVTDWSVVLDWNKTKTVQRVSMLGEVATDVEEMPGQTVEIPLDAIAEVRRVGGWWGRRLELEIRVKGLDVLRGVPGAQGVTLRLGVERRDRSLARAYAIEINELAAAAELRPPDDPRRFGTSRTDPGTTNPGTDPGGYPQ